MHRQRNGCSRGISSICNISSNSYVLWQLQLFGEFVDDTHICLVWDEGGQVFGSNTCIGQSLFCYFCHFPDCPAEDRRAFLTKDRKSTRLNSSHVSIS